MSDFKLIAIAVAFAGVAGWYLGGGQKQAPSSRSTTASISYEECMSSEMRGHDRAMLLVIGRLCAGRSGHEVVLDVARGDYKLHGTPVSAMVRFDDGFLARRKPTRGTFMFSAKPCENSEQADLLKLSALADEEGQFFILTGMHPRCMVMLSVLGRYR